VFTVSGIIRKDTGHKATGSGTSQYKKLGKIHTEKQELCLPCLEFPYIGRCSFFVPQARMSRSGCTLVAGGNVLLIFKEGVIYGQKGDY
jgi:hypothetical protein